MVGVEVISVVEVVGVVKKRKVFGVNSVINVISVISVVEVVGVVKKWEVFEVINVISVIKVVGLALGSEVRCVEKIQKLPFIDLLINVRHL
jgi:hypothetical protein